MNDAEHTYVQSLLPGWALSASLPVALVFTQKALWSLMQMCFLDGLNRWQTQVMSLRNELKPRSFKATD